MDKYDHTYRKWMMLLSKVAESPFGVQLKPEEALQLSKLISDLQTEITELQLQLEQSKIEQLRTPVCEQCALNGGKHGK